MNPETIIAELRGINAWRRGGEEIEQPDPKHIGEVLDAAADSLASLIASNTTLRRGRSEARNQIAELAKVTAERNDWKIRAEEMDGYKADCMALLARVAELEADASFHWITEEELRQSRARVAELVAALREEKRIHPEDFQPGDFRERALARAESATPDHIRDAAQMVSPAKHPDTERLDWLEGAPSERLAEVRRILWQQHNTCMATRCAIDAASKQGGVQ